MENTTQNDKKTRNSEFVERIIERVKQKNETACRAALTRADNPKLENYGWKYILPFCPSASPAELTAFSIVAAAIARVKPEKDGTMSIGDALRVCDPPKTEERNSTELKLNRLVSCNDREELFKVIPRVVRYLQSNDDVNLSYKQLLDDIFYWGDTTKLRWAKSYFIDNI